MKMIVYNSDEDLNVEEQRLLNLGLKHISTTLRESWMVVDEESKGESSHIDAIREYRSFIRKELEDACKTAIDIFERLLTRKVSERSNILYIKSVSDNYRYLAEVTGSSDDAKAAAKNYQTAYSLASETLKVADPLRLSLALNFAVFCFQVLGDKAYARDLAQRSFQEAVSRLGDLEDHYYEDSTLLLQVSVHAALLLSV